MGGEVKFQLYVCSHCGSHRVQCIDWIEPNFDKIIGGMEGATDGCWCEDCERHSKYLGQKEFDKPTFETIKQERS